MKRTPPESEPSKTTPEEPRMLTNQPGQNREFVQKKSSTKRLQSRLSDIGVFRTLVNFTSA
jgi:hypothetical protein